MQCLGWGAGFGYAVALSENGNTALIGGPAYGRDSHRRHGQLQFACELTNHIV